MKLICIDNMTPSGRMIPGLTKHKIYDVLKSDVVRNYRVSDNEYSNWNNDEILISDIYHEYLIRDDNEQPTWYSDDILIPLEKYRELKLSELGI